MKEKLQRLFNCIVKWKARNKMFISGALPRSHLSDPVDGNWVGDVEEENERIIGNAINSRTLTNKQN